MTTTATASDVVRRLYADATADVTAQISEQAGPLTEKILGRNVPAGARELAVDTLTGVYAAVRVAMKTAKGREAALSLDAASHRSVALAALRELRKVANTLDDRQADAIRATADSLEQMLDLDFRPNFRPDRPS